MVPLWGSIAHGIDQIGGSLAVADDGGAARSTAAVDWGHSQCDFSYGCLYGFSSRVPPTLPDEINTIAFSRVFLFTPAVVVLDAVGCGRASLNR